jgi:hypothetical protein
MTKLKVIKELYDNYSQIYYRTCSHCIVGYVGRGNLSEVLKF